MKKIAIIKNILFILIGVLAFFDMKDVQDFNEINSLRLDFRLYLALILFTIGGCGLFEAIKKKDD